MRSVRTAVVVLAGVVGALLPGGAWGQQAGEYDHPVDAQITRPFRAPEHEYGPGHRGIDYGVPSGTEVRASGSGTVKFAGPVAGQGRFVTLQHSGGIETTYSYLSAVHVSQGEQVTQGQLLGESGPGHPDGPDGLHFGAKKTGTYIDPLSLLGEYGDISDLLRLER